MILHVGITLELGTLLHGVIRTLDIISGFSLVSYFGLLISVYNVR